MQNGVRIERIKMIPKPLNIVFVIAGRFSEFERYMREKADKARHTVRRGVDIWDIDGERYIFPTTPDSILGFHGVRVEFIGTYYTIERLKEFEDNAFIARMK